MPACHKSRNHSPLGVPIGPNFARSDPANLELQLELAAAQSSLKIERNTTRINAIRNKTTQT